MQPNGGKHRECSDFLQGMVTESDNKKVYLLRFPTDLDPKIVSKALPTNNLSTVTRRR